MNAPPAGRSPEGDDLTQEQVLRILDLATEVLEGLDELGVASRAELLALMNRLERLVVDES